MPRYVEVDVPASTQGAAAGGPHCVEDRDFLVDASDDDLLGYGVPVEWPNDVRAATEETLLDLADHLPGEAAEALLELATGGTPDRFGVRTSEYGRDYRVGYGMQVLEEGQLRLQLGIEAERRVSPMFGLGQGLVGGEADQRVLGQASVEW